MASDFHDAVRCEDLAAIQSLLERDPALANTRSETDARGAYPLHVAAQLGHAGAAQLLLEYGADPALRDSENDAIALGWAAFFGRHRVVTILLKAGSAPSQRNKHGLTPLACAIGGTQGRWKQFSNASIEDWQASVDAIRSFGGAE